MRDSSSQDRTRVRLPSRKLSMESRPVSQRLCGGHRGITIEPDLINGKFLQRQMGGIEKRVQAIGLVAKCVKDSIQCGV
jgi:hypothetical protein